MIMVILYQREKAVGNIFYPSPHLAKSMGCRGKGSSKLNWKDWVYVHLKEKANA